MNTITGLLAVLITLLLFGCENSIKDIPKPASKVNKEIDTNDIENQIHLQEYLRRENYGVWMSDKKLQSLKDSINYDSIVKNRKYPVYN